MARPNGVVGVNRDLGVDALRAMIPWKRGQTRPDKLQQTYLYRVSLAVRLGQRMVLAVYGRPDQAPVTSAQRDQYCGFLVHVLKRLPRVDDVVIWNEVNNPVFWPAAAGAPAYEALLARCWDALHALRSSVNVIDSTAPHQDPGSFIAAMGAAYRASSRTRPILDTFGHNVYPERSTEVPWAQHDNGSIDEGDYGRLTTVLEQAFGGTTQPLPGQGRTTIWYLEDGFQTRIPVAKRRLYSGAETDKNLLPAAEQAAQLQGAIALAYCQPNVGAFFNFQLLDDHSLNGWQSGVLWADRTTKGSFGSLAACLKSWCS